MLWDLGNWLGFDLAHFMIDPARIRRNELENDAFLLVREAWLQKVAWRLCSLVLGWWNCLCIGICPVFADRKKYGMRLT